MTASKPSFGFFKRNFFPIYNHEFKKFFPLCFLFFFISFNYAVLRGMKDTFMIPDGGSEAISAAKLWGVLPAVVLLKIVFDALSQRTSRIARFNIIIGYFVIYFIIFGLFIYPNSSMLEVHGVTAWLDAKIPFMKSLWGIIRYWPLTLFYIHAEVWGTFALSILFFSFANEVTNVRQSGRFYPFIAVAANIATFIAGEYLQGHITSKLPTVGLSMILVSIGALILIGFFTWFSRVIDADPVGYEVESKVKKKKKKLSLVESFKILASSRYVFLIGILVFSYAICINLFEAVYKDLLKVMAKKHAAGLGLVGQEAAEAAKGFVQSYMGKQLSWIGLSAVVFSLFFATPAMKLGWRFVGSVTPGSLLIGCLLFFSLLFFGQYFGFLASWFGAGIDTFTLVVGLLNVVFIKASKYTFFDPHKESVYIPLTQEEKTQGKSGIEPLARFGKAGGALLINLIVAPLGGVAFFRLPLAIMILVIVVFWLIAVQDLTGRFNKLIKTRKKESAPKKEAVKESK